MKTSNSKDQGFNLIDIMVVVALIGILASLAIPSYRAYKVRTQVAEGIAAVNPIKDEMAYYYTIKGNFPLSNNELGIVPADFASKIIKSISINNSGDIVTSFKAIGNQIQDGESIEFQHSMDQSGSIEWLCKPSDTNGVDFKYIPASCRNS